jgi:hypothetical protein
MGIRVVVEISRVAYLVSVYSLSYVSVITALLFYSFTAAPNHFDNYFFLLAMPAIFTLTPVAVGIHYLGLMLAAIAYIFLVLSVRHIWIDRRKKLYDFSCILIWQIYGLFCYIKLTSMY